MYQTAEVGVTVPNLLYDRKGIFGSRKMVRRRIWQWTIAAL